MLSLLCPNVPDAARQDIDPAIAATLEPIFDMNAPCIRNFDHDKFQHDGYWIWDSIWLPEAQEKFIAACHHAQELNNMSANLMRASASWHRACHGAPSVVPGLGLSLLVRTYRGRYTLGYRELGDDVLSGVPNANASHEPLGWEKVDWVGLGLTKPERYRTDEENQRIIGMRSVQNTLHFKRARKNKCG